MSSLVWTVSMIALPKVLGDTVKSPTPPMGWNSYNNYNCYPNEDIIKQNAKGLVDLGFAKLGYTGVTVDCGWPTNERDSEGRLVWNPELFPSGPYALGEYIHDLGLDFGLYSGAGYLQCGSNDIPASLGYEEIDAQSFADWGGDTLKYDNCYSTSTTEMVDVTSEESQSPERFIKMGAALNNTDRDIRYYICQWGIGTNVPEWAAPLGNSWRMSNDIFNAWRAIWRIVNQAVPHVKHTGPGAFADLDMLIVGLEALSYEEERFHFGFWSMMKSPLMIGGVMDTDEIPAESLKIMKNEEVIAINQDPLAKAAELVIRYTEEEWDIWAGQLSDDRKVLAVANWRNETQTVDVDLSLIAVGEASAHDVWAESDTIVAGVETIELKPHELRLLVLSDVSPATPPEPTDYYPIEEATLEGSALLIECNEAECLPGNVKAGDITGNAQVTFNSVSALQDGRMMVGVDFIHYDFSHTIGDWATNTRNLTITVNDGKAKRWAFPLSGGSWYETGRLMISLDGLVKGNENIITLSPSGEGQYGPDLIGLQVFS